MATGTNEDMMKQVQHFWSMLDELADSDKDSYKRFMEKTLQKGREELGPAKPWMCVRTTILKPHEATLYINICGWSPIDYPQTNTEPIKVTAGAVEDGEDETGVHKVVRVAFNPKVLRECARNDEEQNMLIKNALDYLQEHKKFQLSLNFEICQDINFKGDPKLLRDFFSSQNESRKTVDSERTDLKEEFSKLTPDLLMSQLRGTDSQSEATKDGSQFNLEVNNGHAKESTTGLIQEISSVDSKLNCPEYDVSLKEADEKRSRRIVLRVSLPSVHSVADCELDITETEISLIAREKYDLQLPLPEPILVDDSKAKFTNRTSSLTVTMPTKALKS